MFIPSDKAKEACENGIGCYYGICDECVLHNKEVEEKEEKEKEE